MNVMRKNKFWIFFIIWALILAIGSISTEYLIREKHKKVEEIKNCLESLYLRNKDITPDAAHYKSRLDAYDYLFRKEEVLEESGLAPEKFWRCEIVLNEWKRTNRIQGYFSLPALTLFALGIIYWIGLLLASLFKVITKKRINKKDIILRLVSIFVTIALIIVLFKQSGKVESNLMIKSYNEHYAQEDSHWTSLGGLIELSNEFYKLYVVQSRPSSTEQNFLVQLEYTKRKASTLVEKLNKAPSQKIVAPAKNITKGILNFIDNYTTVEGAAEERQQKRAEGLADFYIVLDNLDEYLMKEALNWSPFPKNLMFVFSEDAKEEYREIASGPPEKEYNIFLLFGYRIYNIVSKNLAKE